MGVLHEKRNPALMKKRINNVKDLPRKYKIGKFKEFCGLLVQENLLLRWYDHRNSKSFCVVITGGQDWTRGGFSPRNHKKKHRESEPWAISVNCEPCAKIYKASRMGFEPDQVIHLFTKQHLRSRFPGLFLARIPDIIFQPISLLWKDFRVPVFRLQDLVEIRFPPLHLRY